MRKRFPWGWFLMGLGSSLQLVASLSMTELYVLIAAVCIFPREYPAMKRTGVHVFFWLSICVVLAGVLSIFIHHVAGYFVLRRMAVVVLVSCAIVVMHNKLRRDPGGFKWYFVGSAFSLVLCTFIFKQSVEMTMLGESSEEIMSGPIFWINRLGAFVSLPAKGWYLQVPLWLSCCCYSFMTVFSMVTTTSGRSAALGALGSIALILLGGKSQRRMRNVGRHFIMVAILGVVALLCLNKIYMHLALKGALGEDAREKYEGQTKLGRDVWGVIMGGRCDSIAPFFICAQHSPLLGFGLMATDDRGYFVDFLAKYGAEEDIEKAERSYVEDLAKTGYRYIPAHSCMGSFWVMYGLPGLIFWIYISFVILRYLIKHAWLVPQWYGWLACGIPGMFWMIFFSPFATRVSTPMFVVACLLARAFARRRIHLPLAEVKKIKGHLR